MEGLPLVCYSTGTMISVLDKLTKMKNHSDPTDEFSVLTESLKKDLLGLKEDFVDKLTGGGATPTDNQVKVCMKHVRELVFEIEHWIDRKPETNMVDPSGRQKFEYFNAKIQRARERFTWYLNLLEIVPTETDAAPIQIAINPRQPVEERTCHGVLDGPRDELVKHLTDKEEMRKVVTVVGMEGLGKTSLAKEIYSELQFRRLFQCQAFVSVGRRTPIREILNDIISQVIPGSYISVHVKVAITELRTYLHMKRYFIVVDGIWSTWAWKLINCALPNNDGSRVLTTTCIMDVGKYCSSYPNDLVYQMEALSEKNSRILFLSRITRQEKRAADFKEVCGNMLNMCGGMPLAIIVAPNFLARKSEEMAEMKMLGKSILSSLKQYLPSDRMTKILHMSFDDLSLPLKCCFLYLGVFPENYTIKKDRLIRLWGAEGFIQRTDKECLSATGERYFNELISRGLIQPVFGYKDDQAVGCMVHGVILDLIRSLSREENFATTAAELSSGLFPCDTIRRFSLNCGNEDEVGAFSTSTVHLSNMRSILFSGDVEGIFDPSPPLVSDGDEEMHPSPSIRVSVNILSTFKLMQVLDLEDTKNFKDHHLQGIGELVLLIYLGIRGTRIRELPEEIGELKQLETLDVRGNRMMKLPVAISKLKRLVHLLHDGHVIEMDRILEMRGLEEYSNYFAYSSSSLLAVVELLRKSELLRMLSVTFNTFTETDLMTFLHEVVNSKLNSVTLRCNGGDQVVPLLADSWEKVNFEPRKFKLKIPNHLFEKVPPNMGSLAGFTHLHMELRKAEAKDFHVLGGMTNLALLKLSVNYGLRRGRFVIKNGIFRRLKVFSVQFRNSLTGLEFKRGAMPQLQSLGRIFTAKENGYQYFDTGFKHLTCLARVRATILCIGATDMEVEAAENAITAQVYENTSKPTLEVSRDLHNPSPDSLVEPLYGDPDSLDEEVMASVYHQYGPGLTTSSRSKSREPLRRKSRRDVTSSWEARQC